MAEKVVIGNAELWHGDCREVLPLLPAVDAVITDPPYGMNYGARPARWPGHKAKQKDGNRWGKAWAPIAGDAERFDPATWLVYKTVVLWGAPHYCQALDEGRTWLVWDKQTPATWTGVDCEVAWTNTGRGGVRMWSCLWHGFLRDREIREHHHPTQKPVDLMAWCMEVTGVAAGATVLDPYMGSASTGLAAIRTGRRFVGIESDRAHFDTACRRMAAEVNL